MPTLKDVIELLLEMGNGQNSSLSISLDTAVNMADIVLDSVDDFVIWDNLGECAFTILEGKGAGAIVDLFCNNDNILYAYRLEGQETVEFLPYLNGRGCIVWIPEDADLMKDSPWKRFD